MEVQMCVSIGGWQLPRHAIRLEILPNRHFYVPCRARKVCYETRTKSEIYRLLTHSRYARPDGGWSPMASQIFPRQPKSAMKCPRCNEDIRDDQPKLFLGEQPYHYECWIRSIIGPRAYEAQRTTVPQDAAVSASQKKHVA